MTTRELILENELKTIKNQLSKELYDGMGMKKHADGQVVANIIEHIENVLDNKETTRSEDMRHILDQIQHISVK